jgi:NAD(P)-dependent dehydrogenase (short-subunit alcohol dehydrogenase family)
MTTESSRNVDPVRFDGQAAIVTGGGGGIGRAIADELASRGASVLVNDFGGDTRGAGGSPTRAEQAVKEIRAAGGRAEADATPVGTPAAARAIVSHALDAFGRLDILVNNAGIAQPGLFTEASDEELELGLRTNLVGPYALMRAAWDGMRRQRYGRVLNVSSNAALGIGRNAMYATSKAGLLGLTLDAAAEGQAEGILVNAMMPAAYSRMIEGIPDPAFVAWFRQNLPAAKVAASLAYFLSRESQVTGRIFSIGGGRLARVVFAENDGVLDARDAETTRALQGAALDASRVRTLESSADELGLYTAAFPFEGHGGVPALDLDTVANSNRPAS